MKGDKVLQLYTFGKIGLEHSKITGINFIECNE